MSSQGHADVFEDVLNLEDQYYREGYDLGVADGSKSGRIEGRVFGLEKGFEKFLEMGKLSGKATVWEARLPGSEKEVQGNDAMPNLSNNERLRKHVERLATLTNPDGVSTENSEDAVSEFDDRLKDAKAKATLISRITGEDESSGIATDRGGASKGIALRMKKDESESNVAGRRTGEMEDFIGLPGRS